MSFKKIIFLRIRLSTIKVFLKKIVLKEKNDINKYTNSRRIKRFNKIRL